MNICRAMIVHYNLLEEIRFIKNRIKELQREIDNCSADIILYKEKKATIRILKDSIKLNSYYKKQWENRLNWSNKKLSKLIV